MKHTLYLITLFAGFLLTISSCKKDADQLPPETIDSVKSVLPKQIILTDNEDSLIISFKYDTANHKVELYEDDPSTSNLYDKLAITYTFNRDGYLVSYVINTDKLYGSNYENATVNINRAGDNKINYVAYDIRDYNQKDTTFYTYQSESGGTKVTTKGIEATFEGITTYRYDNNYDLLEFQGEYAYATFQYNPNKSINKITGMGAGDNVTDFLYSSGIPDEKEDWLSRLLLGKDHYLWDLMELNPFVFWLDPDYDSYLVSATNPYHLTHMKDTHQPDASPTGIEDATITYELNDQKLLSKVSFTVEAVGQFPAYTEIIKIKY